MPVVPLGLADVLSWGVAGEQSGTCIAPLSWVRGQQGRGAQHHLSCASNGATRTGCLM
jgi:hypothetical protein